MRHVIDPPKQEGLVQWLAVALTFAQTRRISRKERGFELTLRSPGYRFYRHLLFIQQTIVMCVTVMHHEP